MHPHWVVVVVPIHCCAAYGIMLPGVCVGPEGCLEKMSTHLGVV